MLQRSGQKHAISSHWSGPESFTVDLHLELRPNETEHLGRCTEV